VVSLFDKMSINYPIYINHDVMYCTCVTLGKLSQDINSPDSPSKNEDNYIERLNMPTIRGGLNGSISDILEASGYGTETDFKTDDDIKYVDL